MSEITNPPPDQSVPAHGPSSRPDTIANPPLDGDSALDDHLNPSPETLPGSVGAAPGTAPGSSIENPPPWDIGDAEAPRNEAPTLEPLNVPASDVSDDPKAKAKPKAPRRRAAPKKPRK